MVEILTTGEKFSVGGITTLLGLGMTFIVLGILIGCVYLVSVLAKELTKFIDKQKEAIKAKKVEKNQSEPVTSVKDTTVADAAEIDPETMVAIRAAVEIYLRENGDDNGAPHENVTIKSVTKI